MAENRYGPDGTTPVHLQVPPMRADEYDQLIANPAAFIANVLLPRKFEALYADRAAFKAALKVYAEDKAYSLIKLGGAVDKRLEETYGVLPLLNMKQKLNTPLDHLFDFFRGFRGTLTDLRRQEQNVRAAIAAIWASEISSPSFCSHCARASQSRRQVECLNWGDHRKLISLPA